MPGKNASPSPVLSLQGLICVRHMCEAKKRGNSAVRAYDMCCPDSSYLLLKLNPEGSTRKTVHTALCATKKVEDLKSERKICLRMSRLTYRFTTALCLG